MQLQFNDTIYKRAVGEIWGYWEGHTCDSNDCTLNGTYLSKAYNNSNPQSEDMEIVLENLIMEADLRGIDDDEMDDDEGRGEVNLLIYGLEQELKKGGE
tara:strand:- start:50 stop:346 length:297 start_codon:yes stop_codon:yes gene_type:complete